MKKDIQLTDGDQITIYELSLTFYVVVNQANNFQFCDLDLYRIHKQKEIQIFKDNEGFDADLPLHLQEETLEGPWILKCEQEGWAVTPPYEAETFDVFIPDLRKKRSVQAKVVEHMVLKMFSK